MFYLVVSPFLISLMEMILFFCAQDSYPGPAVEAISPSAPGSHTVYTFFHEKEIL